MIEKGDTFLLWYVKVQQHISKTAKVDYKKPQPSRDFEMINRIKFFSRNFHVWDFSVIYIVVEARGEVTNFSTLHVIDIFFIKYYQFRS